MEISYSLRATLTLTTGYVYTLDGGDIVDFTLREGVRGGGMLLGAAPAAWGRLTLLDPSGAWRPGGSRLGSRVLQGATVEVEADGGSGYEAAGCFIVSRIEAREGESEVVLSGYDAMAHALGAPFADTLEYPQTLSGILAHIVSQTGLTLYGAPACNAGVSITQKPDWGANCTLRRALGWAAGAMGCFAHFDREGRLTLSPAWPDATPALLPPSQALRLTLSGQRFCLERVRVLPRGGSDPAPVEAALPDAADASADNTLEISDNALFRPGAAELSTLASGLLAALQGMTLTPFEGDFFRLPDLACGSRVTVRDLSGAEHASQVFSLTLRLEGAPTLALSCDPDTSGVSLPTSLSASGLLNGGALGEGVITARMLAAGSVDAEKLAARSVTAEKLAAGAVTAEKIAAGAISADAITSGKLSTDRLIVGGTEFSIVRALNQLAQTVVTGDTRLSGAVLADGTISAAKVTSDFGTGLELSSNAAILLLAGLLDGTNSHMELTDSAINMVGGEINIATDDLQIRGMDGGDEILSLTPEDGLSACRVVAGRVEAPNVFQVHDSAAIPWRGSIQESLDACPKCLARDAVLTVPAGTYTEDVVIQNFVGSLTLDMARAVALRGTLTVKNCTRVRVLGDSSGASQIYPLWPLTAVKASYCGSFSMSDMMVSGWRSREAGVNGTGSVIELRGCASVTLDNVCAEYGDTGIYLGESSCAYLTGCKGGQSGADPDTNANLLYGLRCESGARAQIAVSVPMGGSADTSAGDAAIAGTATPTAGGMNYTPPTEWTRTFALQSQCQYAMMQSTSTSGTSVSQGRYGAYAAGRSGWRMGCWWFDLSDLAGKTVTAATLRIRRASAGYSQAAAVKVFSYACAYADRESYGVPENYLSQSYAGGAVEKETELSLDVSALIDGAFISGGYALAVYEPQGWYNPAQQWSDNYANFYSLGSAYEPTLTVTYQ